MKSPRKTKNSNSTTSNLKSVKEEKEQQKKQQVDAKSKEKEAQFQKLEEYVNESGLALAFNIIFAELISKQILPENFFTYTSMRLKQIGKEIEGLKTKETISAGKNEEGEDNNRLTDINHHLENELIEQRNRNIELANENEQLTQEKNKIEKELKTALETLDKIKLKESSLEQYYNERR